MHATDAAPRGIADGDLARVFNHRGSMTLRARVLDGTRVGVVSLPQGFWPSLLPGGSSANTLTPDGLSDRGGGGDFHDARVEVALAWARAGSVRGRGRAHSWLEWAEVPMPLAPAFASPAPIAGECP